MGTEDADRDGLGAQLKELASSIDLLLTGTFRPKTREAQNMTMLLSAIGLVILFGLVEPDKAVIAGLELKTSATSASIVLWVTSLFYCLRFGFFYYQDITLHRVRRVATGAIIAEVIKPIIESHARVAAAVNKFNEARQNVSDPTEEIYNLASVVVDECRREKAETRQLGAIRNVLLFFYKRFFRIENIRFFIEVAFPVLLLGCFTYTLGQRFIAFP